MTLSALVTAGPTIERIDPVRYISNFSSGKQGYAIANALVELGVNVTLVSGPTALSQPSGVTLVMVESAQQMLEASLASLPVDIAICSAAVSDWRPKTVASQKLKKSLNQNHLSLLLDRNPDILLTLSKHPQRPYLVVGFAAETSNIIGNSAIKHRQKSCDWLVVNDVSQGSVFGDEENQITLLKQNSPLESWPKMTKIEIAQRLVLQIMRAFENRP